MPQQLDRQILVPSAEYLEVTKVGRNDIYCINIARDYIIIYMQKSLRIFAFYYLLFVFIERQK